MLTVYYKYTDDIMRLFCAVCLYLLFVKSSTIQNKTERGRRIVSMPYTEAQKRATAKYNAKAYDRIEIKVAKGRKAEIQAFAESRGESVNAFVTRLIDQAMEAGENHKE